MSIPKRTLQSKLKQKFGFEDTSGSKHEGLALYVNDKKVATVRLSRSHDTIDDSILRVIAKQCWVSMGFLREMVDCTKSQEDYATHLKRMGRLD